MKKLILFLASGGGVGYLKPFPGGFGSFEGFVISWLLFYFPFQLRFIIIFFTVLISFLIGGLAEKLIGHKDPSQIVIDEIVGVLIASLFVNPNDNFSVSFLKFPLFLFLAFLLFVIFDAFKPFPANKAQHLKGGFGVVLDDVISGLYAGICLFFLNVIR